MSDLEEKLVNGYEEYLKQPLAELGDNNSSELYNNNWVIIEGLSIVYPHPHRYCNFTEFVFFCGKKEELFNRFCKDE